MTDDHMSGLDQYAGTLECDSAAGGGLPSNGYVGVRYFQVPIEDDRSSDAKDNCAWVRVFKSGT